MPDDPPNEPPEPPEPEPPTPTDVDGIRRALSAERRAHRQTRAELDRAHADHQQHDDRLAQANRRVLHAELRARAAGKLATPDDVLALLDIDQFQANPDGEYDHAALDAAIDQLVADKPYLAPRSAPPRVPQGIRGESIPTMSGDAWLRQQRDR